MRIMYVIPDVGYKRVFESFKDDDRAEQILMCKRPSITTGLVPEDYSDCSISKKYIIDSAKDLQKYINKLVPDVYVQPDMSGIHYAIKLPKQCKRVFVSHGIVAAKRMIEMSLKDEKFKLQWQKSWGGFDLYCGAMDEFVFWLDKLLSVPKEKIVLDALPQLDLLHKHKYYNLYKQRVLNATKNPTAKRSILFFGNRVAAGRDDYEAYNKDYFDVLFELERLAIKNDWVILLKPKYGYKKVMKFLTANKDKWGGWPGKYMSRFTKIHSSKYIHVITTNSHAYRYFFADVIVASGITTVEVDSAVANKPMVVFRPLSREKNISELDPLGGIQFGTIIRAEKIKELEELIVNANCKDGHKYLKSVGITPDGLAHRRVLDAILRMK